MKILVTGAGGFVGRHLVRAGNAAGHEMVASGRAECDFESGRDSVRSQMAELMELTHPDALIHLAGPLPTSDAGRCERLCVEGTRGLLESLERFPEVRLVAAGSASEIGTFPEPRPCVDESVECDPISDYAKGKLLQSDAVIDAGGISIRLFNSTGPGQGTNVVTGRIIHQLAQGADRLEIRETSSVRDFLDVRDASRAFLLAAESLPSGRYNVCSGSPRSIGELVELACNAAGVTNAIVEVELPEYEGDFVCGDPSLLESLGWRREFELPETIQDFFNWAKEQHSPGPPESFVA